MESAKMVAKRAINKRKTGKQPKQMCKTCGNETKSVLLFKCCPDCNSRRIATLAETGEKFCKACGLVLL